MDVSRLLRSTLERLRGEPGDGAGRAVQPSKKWNLASFVASLVTVGIGVLVNLATSGNVGGLVAVTMITVAVFLDLVFLRTAELQERSAVSNGRNLRLIVLVQAAILVVVLIAGVATIIYVRTDHRTVLFQDNFHSRSKGWAQSTSPAGTTDYIGKTFRVRPRSGFADWITTPGNPSLGSAITIEASARVMYGSGGWGVWCRGTSAGDRYEFDMSHTGEVQIKTPDYSTNFEPVQGLNAFAVNKMTARCFDAPGGGGVQLTLSVNNHLILSYMESGKLLAPGPAGLHGFSFGDVGGLTADVRFNKFSIYQGMG